MYIRPIIIGTAGHIDHGKSSLVHALTGIDTDRLKVEKVRGITTELGFAHWDVGTERFGVVDVPGHERFIKSMVAGAGGIDIVCLVIAADEGVMPQTREHLDICNLLGVRAGVVVLSKADLVDADWMDMVSQELRQTLAGTFLHDAKIVPVSSKTGTGLPELKNVLAKLAEKLPVRSSQGTFRLPVDRVFTMRGFGTVVTGTIASGSVQVSDSIEILPGMQTAKIRGLQVHGEALPSAVAGMRVAINIAGVAREQINRGDMLCHLNGVQSSHVFDATFRLLPSVATPLARRSKVLLHHLTAQVMASLILIDRETLLPGQEAPVQLRIDASRPLAVLPGDHFIARGFTVLANYGSTLGGGKIVRVAAAKVRKVSTDAAETLARMQHADARTRIELEIKSAEVAGISFSALAMRLGYDSEILHQAISTLATHGDIVSVGEADSAILVHGHVVAALEKQLLGELRDRENAQLGKEELRTRLPKSLPAKVYEQIIISMVGRGAIDIDGDLVAKPKQRRETTFTNPFDQKLLESFRGWGLAPPRPDDVAGAVSLNPSEVKAGLTRLLQAKQLVKVKPDYFADALAIAQLKAKLLDFLQEHGQINPTQWKELCGLTRKHSIPLAEYFDGEKVTLRIGDIRKKRG